MSAAPQQDLHGVVVADLQRLEQHSRRKGESPPSAPHRLQRLLVLTALEPSRFHPSLGSALTRWWTCSRSVPTRGTLDTVLPAEEVPPTSGCVLVLVCWWVSNPALGDYAGPSWGPTRSDRLTQLLTCSSVSRYSSWKLNALAEAGTTALENLSPWTTILPGPQKA